MKRSEMIDCMVATIEAYEMQHGGATPEFIANKMLEECEDEGVIKEWEKE